jgi:hypothetical protein
MEDNQSSTIPRIQKVEGEGFFGLKFFFQVMSQKNTIKKTNINHPTTSKHLKIPKKTDPKNQNQTQYVIPTIFREKIIVILLSLNKTNYHQA